MNLYFLASNGEKRLVSTDVTPKTAHKEISKYVKELNDPTKAAIASNLTAELYDLEVLKAEINKRIIG